MTQNQIAYQELQLDKRKTDVAEKSQEEVERHNQATENLQAQANAINEFAAQTERNYKQEVNALTKEYNQRYYELRRTDQANEQARTLLQERLTEIESLKQQAQQSYYEDMANIQVTQNEIRQQEVLESRRHNTEVEKLTNRSNALNERGIELQGLRLDFEKRQFEVESGLKARDIANRETQTLYQGMSVLNAQNTLNFEMNKYFATGAAIDRSNIFRNYVGAIGSIFNPFSAALGRNLNLNLSNGGR